ncbi:hypothetical protein KC726_04720 [Candidatus Woesebacteria bacterium]|nr:hypothetical protein [Candidatus Woesebacteria bacterium]
MKKIVIAGTSGVGKSYLEALLVANHGFFQPLKYTTRTLRPTEQAGKQIISITGAEFEHMKKGTMFGFTLHFDNAQYGWLKSDLEKNINIVLAITLRDLEHFCKTHPSFWPIVMYFPPQSNEFIMQRLKKREYYEEKNSKERTVLKDKLKKRIQLSREDNKHIQAYSRIAQTHGGRAFSITDDTIVHNEILPFIIDLP